jgi:hypothetical protein
MDLIDKQPDDGRKAVLALPKHAKVVPKINFLLLRDNTLKEPDQIKATDPEDKQIAKLGLNKAMTN